MAKIVRDDGFHQAHEVFYDDHEAIWIEPSAYNPDFEFHKASLISVHFENFADGRGFGIARDIRARGYQGKLRAVGYVIADQYAMARRVGFDEVEISDALALRQDATQWIARSDWKAFDYQAHLGQEVG